jgi:hypothetical protein
MISKASPPLRLGETFLREHLWVVCTLPDESGSVIAVNFTTKRLDSDVSCVVKAGEHSFVAHDTVLAYERMLVWDTSTQQKILDNPPLCPGKAPVKPIILLRIQNGALKSKLAAPKLQQRIRESMAEQAKAEAEESAKAAAVGWGGRRRW